MEQSTITEKGQTTIPSQVRKALNLKPHQKIQWEMQTDGSVLVRPQPSALDLFGSLQSDIAFPGIRKEKEAAHRAIAEDNMPVASFDRDFDQFEDVIRIEPKGH